MVKPPVISSPVASLEDVNVVRKKRGRPSNSERAAMELQMQNNEDDDERQPGKRGKTNFQFDEYWVSNILFVCAFLRLYVLTTEYEPKMLVRMYVSNL
jgi:hypothetical protein